MSKFVDVGGRVILALLVAVLVGTLAFLAIAGIWQLIDAPTVIQVIVGIVAIPGALAGVVAFRGGTR